MSNSQHTISDLAEWTPKSLNAAISKTIGYKFKNESILVEALTHPSLRTRHMSKTYERLEFVGDSVLSMIVSAMLFKLFPDEEEGALVERRKLLVCGSAVTDVAKELKLGDFLLMKKCERDDGGQRKPHNLENALEALIGAIHLDGGFEKAKRFVHRFWDKRAESMLDLEPPRDIRNVLQEWLQKRRLPLPRYKMMKRSGLIHLPEFTVSLNVEGYGAIEACASTKKGAEKEAAKLMLEKIKGVS